MYFFPTKVEEKRPSMNDFAHPPNSVLLNNRSQLDALPNPIMERPQFSSMNKPELPNESSSNIQSRSNLQSLQSLQSDRDNQINYNNSNTNNTSNINTSNSNTSSNNTSNNINELDGLDPYDVLGIQPNATLQEAKISYKYLALKHHPDKGGNERLFNIITKAFESISQRLQAVKPREKQEHNELKKGCKLDFRNNKLKINMNGKKFNLEKFNSVYEKNKIKNPYEKGYSNWKEKLQDENISIGSNVSTSSFNAAFTKSRQKNNYSKQIIQHNEPQATISGDLGFSELGVDEIDTFSKNEGDSNSIGFTDYKDAYTTESKLINPDDVTINRPDSIGKYKNERENINFTMTEEQTQMEKIKQKQMENAEFNRMQRVNLFDEMATEQYNKVNQMMLSNS